MQQEKNRRAKNFTDSDECVPLFPSRDVHCFPLKILSIAFCYQRCRTK